MSVPVNYIGIAAGLFTAASGLPQLVKIIREKKTEGISVAMLAVLIIGLGLWTWYGIEKKDWPIILTNAFSFVVNLSIAILRIIYRNR